MKILTKDLNVKMISNTDKINREKQKTFTFSVQIFANNNNNNSGLLRDDSCQEVVSTYFFCSTTIL